MTDERERWNAKFQAGEAQLTEADALVVEACAGRPAGSALDLGGGAGRHALWLAERGWRTVLADVSDEGLRLAAQRAEERGVALTLRREGADETVAWALRSGAEVRFDLIVVVWFLAREDFAALPRMLAPGGVLVYKTYTTDHVRFTEGHSPRYALKPGELGSAFAGLETVVWRETDGVAEFVGRRRSATRGPG